MGSQVWLRVYSLEHRTLIDAGWATLLILIIVFPLFLRVILFDRALVVLFITITLDGAFHGLLALRRDIRDSAGENFVLEGGCLTHGRRSSQVLGK